MAPMKRKRPMLDILRYAADTSMKHPRYIPGQSSAPARKHTVRTKRLFISEIQELLKNQHPALFNPRKKGGEEP